MSATGPGTSGRHEVGCVSFLNSKPLIEPVLGRGDVGVHFAVPSALLGMFESGEVTAALMSVVDFQGSRVEPLLVPAGMIGCDGATLTVRIFSRVPMSQVSVVYGDTDSHTSVVLARVILKERYGREVEMVALKAREGVHPGGGPETMLLIGDKVVNASPSAAKYPYQLDLGEEWKGLTGLPFVFAMWMIRADAVGADVGKCRELVGILAEARRLGAGMTEGLLAKYAREKGWPEELARQYFTAYLKYEVTGRAREGLARFLELAGRLGYLEIRRPVKYFEG